MKYHWYDILIMFLFIFKVYSHSINGFKEDVTRISFFIVSLILTPLLAINLFPIIINDFLFKAIRLDIKITGYQCFVLMVIFIKTDWSFLFKEKDKN